jgi:beta-N-acetylhexosaminidase
MIALARTIVISLLLFLLTGCSLSPATTATTPNPTSTLAPKPSPTKLIPTPTPTPLSDSDIVRNIVHKMSLDQKLGQMVIVEFYGSTLTSDDVQMIQSNHVSGVLIENKNGNAQMRAQLVNLIKGLQGKASIPLFITTDYEGGIVNELRQITGERPSEAAIGATRDPQKAYDAGLGAAADLTGLGLNVNFMPIVDVLTNPNNPGLPQRTFGSNPTIVTQMGQAYLRGLTAGGVIGCLKHFPGLGSATIDPHYSLPTMNRSLTTLNNIDFVPYRNMINQGIVPMVMVTHILNPQLDPNLPTSLSPHVVTDLLRNSLHFQGVIISDTLWMGGVSNTYDLAQAAVMAVKAGTDLLLGPRGLADTQSMLYGLRQAVTSGKISESQIDVSVTRILALKLKYKILSRDKALQMAQVAESSEVRGSAEWNRSVGDVRRGMTLPI